MKASWVSNRVRVFMVSADVSLRDFPNILRADDANIAVLRYFYPPPSPRWSIIGSGFFLLSRPIYCRVPSAT